jgi:hypothetical protein
MLMSAEVEALGSLVAAHRERKSTKKREAMRQRKPRTSYPEALGTGAPSCTSSASQCQCQVPVLLVATGSTSPRLWPLALWDCKNKYPVPNKAAAAV